MIEVDYFGDRQIAYRGVAQLFYQDGFPISMAISELRAKGIEVSMLHVADQCMKNGWSPKTTIAKLRADFEDDIDDNPVDLAQLEHFCYASYEEQREMIFQYLFGNRENGANWLREKLTVAKDIATIVRAMDLKAQEHGKT